jgi:hypothetical protein
MKANMTLSKSDYMLFLRHPAWLWLKKFDKSKLPPVDANLQAMFDAGHEFEVYAEKLFPNAVKLGFSNYNEYLSLPTRTSQALEQGATAIFQGRFEEDGLTCIVDVLSRVQGNDFDLIEVKSSTKAKPEHEFDLAFQVLVLEKAGLSIRSISVIHANKEYVRDGEIDPAGITSKTDVTDQVRALASTTLLQIDMARNTLSNGSTPDISPRYVNQLNIPRVGSQWMQEWLEIYRSLKPDLNKYSIYNLSYPSPEQIGQLEDQSIELINDIPEELALRVKQEVQIQTTRDNKRIIDKDKIKSFLDTFTYPLYFFDYETFSSVIPFFDGCKPYADYPFQYSLHILESPDVELKHVEHLHSDSSNPMPGLIKQLKHDIGDTGTILTWNMSYEKGCNDRMAEFYPEHKEFLANVNERIEDLMIPFSKMWFFDKDFMGSASVKKVMPVLAPELSYKELNVGDGLLARRTWTQTVLEGKNKLKRTEIMYDLSKYCTLDTFAMVRILEELKV